MAILDPPPSPAVRTALAFGDAEFLYRDWFLDLQNAGDTGGRMTPMRDYNYDNVLAWLQSLQQLDPRAQAHLLLATHYFSQTPKQESLRALVGFITDDALKLPQEKWFWLTQAEVIAEARIHDLPLALALAQQTAELNVTTIPAIVRMFPAVLLAKMDRRAEARAWIARTVEKYGPTFTVEERNWVDFFLQGLPATP
ncbi:MAG: hypothetical protein ACXWM1_04155 [Candidatus Binataceae bacterium]